MSKSMDLHREEMLAELFTKWPLPWHRSINDIVAANGERFTVGPTHGPWLIAECICCLGYAYGKALDELADEKRDHDATIKHFDRATDEFRSP